MTTYVALLRGINVGGNRTVEMKRLKAALECIGLDDVRTYINSGNVIFESDEVDRPRLAGVLEDAIAADFGRRQAGASTHNLWIPDGTKEAPVDRAARRGRLLESLDAVFADRHDPAALKDAVEGKLFGIGSESFVAGSHEFYLAFAMTRGVMLCLDTGHFHPTESVGDKISALLPFVPELLLHVSRGVRWDSDHVVAFNDELQAITHEIVRNDALKRVHIGLDYFDASINRTAAWVIGARNTLRALLDALLEPRDLMERYEADGDFSSRLALQEGLKAMPSGAVWDYYCMQKEVPVGIGFMDAIREYEKKELVDRL